MIFTQFCNWPALCIFFGISLFLSLLMRWQSSYFYTMDIVLRKFSILDLEFPATQAELINTIKGLFKLPPENSHTSVKALKTQLYIDFIFTPFAYGFVAILCLLVSKKMSLTIGTNVFVILAVSQILALVCNIIENVYLLSKIKTTVEPSSPAKHKAYFIMAITKLSCALVSVNCAVAAIFYFWLSGNYTLKVLPYLLIFIGEILLFVICSKIIFTKKTDKKVG